MKNKAIEIINNQNEDSHDLLILKITSNGWEIGNTSCWLKYLNKDFIPKLKFTDIHKFNDEHNEIFAEYELHLTKKAK